MDKRLEVITLKAKYPAVQISLDEALSLTPAQAWEKATYFDNRAASYSRGGCPADLEWARHLVDCSDFFQALGNRLAKLAREIASRAKEGKLSRKEALTRIAEIYGTQDLLPLALDATYTVAEKYSLAATRAHQVDLSDFWFLVQDLSLSCKA